MRFSPLVLALANFVATSLAACDGDGTLPGTGNALRLYSAAECYGDFQDIPLSDTNACWDPSSDVFRADYFAVVRAASATTSEDVVCYLYAKPACQGAPFWAIRQQYGGEIGSLPRAGKRSVRCTGEEAQ